MVYKFIGTTLFYLTWPFLHLVTNRSVRVRVVIESGDEVLLVKSWYGPNAWLLPGGGMKVGEDAKRTAVREIKEELGIDILEREVSIVTKTPVNMTIAGLPFRYTLARVELGQKPQISISSELTQVEWHNSKKLVVTSILSKYKNK